jgi:hypothetical protein
MRSIILAFLLGWATKLCISEVHNYLFIQTLVIHCRQAIDAELCAERSAGTTLSLVSLLDSQPNFYTDLLP